jgi:hypothetical protein
LARDFDGTDDKLDMGDATNLNGAFPMTVGAWVNLDALALAPFISRGSTASNGAGWYFGCGDASGNVTFGKSGVNTYDSSNADVQIATGTWSYHAAVIDNATGGTFYKVALDGTVTSQADSSVGSFSATACNKSRIACLGRIADSNFVNGRIAELSVYVGEAFTSNEIRTLALYGQSAVAYTPDGYWRLLGTDDPEPDSSGNSYNGTVTGAVQADGPPGIPASAASYRLMMLGIG